MGPKKGAKWSITFRLTILDPARAPFGAKKNVNHVIVKISTFSFLLCFLIIVPMEFRVGRRCVRYGVGQEHGQQIL